MLLFFVGVLTSATLAHYLPFEMELLFVASNGVNVSRIIRRGRTGTAIKYTKLWGKQNLV